MATNTFERKLEINDIDSLKRLFDVMSVDPPLKPFSQHSFSDSERDRSEQLLKQCLSHFSL